MKYTDVEVDAHERGVVIWIKSRSTRIHLSGSIFAEPHAWLTREVGAGIPADYYVTGDAEGERKSTGLFSGVQAGSLTVKSVVDHASAIQAERLLIADYLRRCGDPGLPRLADAVEAGEHLK